MRVVGHKIGQRDEMASHGSIWEKLPTPADDMSVIGPLWGPWGKHGRKRVFIISFGCRPTFCFIGRNSNVRIVQRVG